MISTPKFEAMVLSLKKVDCPLQTTPPSEGIQLSWGLVHEWGESGAEDWQTDRSSIWSDADAIPSSYGKEGAELKGKSLLGDLVPTLTYGHKLRIVSEKMRLHI